MLKISSDQRREIVLPALWVLAIAILDGVWRGAVVGGFAAFSWGFYLWSIVYLGLTLWLLRQAVAGLWQWRRKVAAIAVVATSALHGFVLVGSYVYFEYFGALPGLFTFQFLFEEGAEGGNIVSLSIHFGIVLLLISAALLSGAALTWPRAAILQRRRFIWLPLVFWLVSTIALHNNVRFQPGAFVPGVQVLFSFSRAAQNVMRGHARPIRMLNTPLRPPLKITRPEPLNYNILFVLHESLRAQNMQVYGYGRDTTPALSRFLERQKDNVVLFDRAYSNATRTMASFAGFLSGVTTMQPNLELHTAPLLFDYAKVFPGNKTFLISSHRLEWGNIIHYLNNDLIDVLWHKSNGNVPVLSKVAVDDSHSVTRLLQFFDALTAAERFTGVLHTRGTHTPYVAPKDFQRFGSAKAIDKYDNSILYLDHNEARVLDEMEKRGLLENTVIIALADHGEAMGEHGYFGHVHTFYDEEARIPLWIYLPPTLPERDRRLAALRANSQTPVSVADVVPTMLELLGLWEADDVAPLKRFYVGAPLTQPQPRSRYVLMQNHNDVNNIYLFAGVGMVTERYKYLLRVEQTDVLEELYDLRADPFEQNNLWDTSDIDQQRRVYRVLHGYENTRVLLNKYRPNYLDILPKSQNTDKTTVAPRDNTNSALGEP